MGKPCLLLCVLLLVAGCGGNPTERFAKLAEEFVYTSLSFSPISATSAGLHKYAGENLDELLDDLSPAAIERQRQFYEKFRARLQEAVRPEQLPPEDRADYDIIQDQISLSLLELNEIQSYLHNPTLYVELVGNALFNPYVLEYAPKPERARHIIARLRKIPLFVDQAKLNLTSSSAIWSKVAAEENTGNLRLIETTLRAGMPEDQREDYARAAGPAQDALHSFQDYLQKSLAFRNQHDWRLGPEKYTRKFRYVLETGLEPTAVLASAESELQKVRARMLELALPLHRNLFPGHRDHAGLAEPERANRIISEVLARIAGRHSTRESYMPDAQRDLEEARQFVLAKNLLTLPRGGNLQVIETPEFMRGSYAVGGFNPAPALEPQLGAFYWVTPIPPDWPSERVESKLREYNFYKLKLLTMHEAVPGHYVQFEYANQMQPQSRRLLRSIFGNGPYIEGWAQYATQTMLDEGFLNSSPELRLTFLKEELRVLANAVLDIRLQMLNMTDQEALGLMQEQTFQEKEEATEKLQRAKLSSAQLPTYLVGWRGWLRARDAYRQARGASYRLKDFHDQALAQGAVPLPVLERLLTNLAPGGTPSR